MEQDHRLLISAHVTAATAEVEHQTSKRKKRPGFICAGALYAYIVYHCLEGRQDILFGHLAYSTTGLDNHNIMMFRKTSITPAIWKTSDRQNLFPSSPHNLGIKQMITLPTRVVTHLGGGFYPTPLKNMRYYRYSNWIMRPQFSEWKFQQKYLSCHHGVCHNHLKQP